jgi:hypothetical protein
VIVWRGEVAAAADAKPANGVTTDFGVELAHYQLVTERKNP